MLSASEAGHDGPSQNRWSKMDENVKVLQILNIRNTTQEAFILYTLDAHWTTITLKIVGRKTLHVNSTGGLCMENCLTGITTFAG